MELELKDVMTISISVVALGFSIISFIRTKMHEKYKIGDDKLLDILKINLQYPEFDNLKFTNNYDTCSDKKLSKQYEIYAIIIWNYLELLFDYYGRRRIKKIGFWGALEYWSDLHYKWFSKKENYCAYPKPFIEFIENIRADIQKRNQNL
jgi:hypothetical protein